MIPINIIAVYLKKDNSPHGVPPRVSVENVYIQYDIFSANRLYN